MLKKLPLLLVALCWPYSSYSESITPYYGYTDNAAANALRWSMGDVFPTPPGLDVNAVIYRYTPQKLTEDDMLVHVQNENALGDGYIFRETDDWSGKAGGVEIRKVIGMPNVPRDYWGDGSIEVEGNGTIEDASVVYSYRVDPCYDPQFSPNCPGYKIQMPDIPEPDLTMYTVEASQTQYDEEEFYDENDEDVDEKELEEKEKEEERDRKERLEKALSAADNSALFANALANSQMLNTINSRVNMNQYYEAEISGGVYKETVKLIDAQLSDNKRAYRNNFAQQALHEKMVDSQYNNNRSK